VVAVSFVIEKEIEAFFAALRQRGLTDE
jgi:hypothetical protein